MNDTKSRNEKTLSLPLTQSARQNAHQFASLCNSRSAARQIYLNTLAVLAVNDYLQMMGIETDLNASESWNPVLRLAADVSDLNVVALGHLECRAVIPGQTHCPIPQDVWEDRIGYVAIEIDETQQRATLLGFSETITTNELPINELRSIEALLYHLQHLRQQAESEFVAVSKSLVLSPKQPPIVLSQWFKGIFGTDWQPLETLNLTPIPTVSLRASTTATVKGAKLVDCGIELGSQKIVLLILLTPEPNEQVGILVQVHPAQGKPYLPCDLRLAVLSETGETLKQVYSRSLDNYIQLPYFQGISGESFSIQITLDRACSLENFII
ncbi:MAG: DUF1822 family protein [Hydrococcus sp. Prado102]|jgi:hypothetical protein|nr:DUF1822 family protein [Hydrococcus sp. Prado102]